MDTDQSSDNKGDSVADFGVGGVQSASGSGGSGESRKVDSSVTPATPVEVSVDAVVPKVGTPATIQLRSLIQRRRRSQNRSRQRREGLLKKK